MIEGGNAFLVEVLKICNDERIYVDLGRVKGGGGVSLHWVRRLSLKVSEW